MRSTSRIPLTALLLLSVVVAGCSDPVESGEPRVTVLTPTLVRLEWSAEAAFEDRPTFTAVERSFPAVPHTEEVVDGHLEVRTDAVLVRYRLGSGPFDARNVEVTLLGDGSVHHPDFDAAVGPREGQLGGWLRSLDAVDEPPPNMNSGLLDRSGVFLLDDSEAAIFLGEGMTEARPEHRGTYQDGYLFAYGDDYAQGLRDFRALTGPAPLLPRQAFGIWYTSYKPYSLVEYQTSLLPAFRSHSLPLDVLLVDTNWKASPWAGWQWETSLFPDPDALATWAAGEGLTLSLNIHPCIPESDPALPGLEAEVGDLLLRDVRCAPFGRGIGFDWGEPDVVDAYFALHGPVHIEGARWWLDWCCDGSTSTLPGVTPDAWINSLYEADTRARDLRPMTLTRMGGGFESYGVAEYRSTGAWADHRYGVHSTHDLGASFEMMCFASEFTAGVGASVGWPYEAHVVGGFLGEQPPDDLFVRWTQMATFQPILWLHSNYIIERVERLPWEFSDPARDATLDFMRLRHSLIPYSYTLAREAHDTGMPMVRALYLAYPDQSEAFERPQQYLYGEALLVTPVCEGGTTATTEVWLPPGRWTDWFTGETSVGPALAQVSTGWTRMPVHLGQGGIVAQQDYMDHVGQLPVDHLTLSIAPGPASELRLYEDAGDDFGFEAGEYAFTPISQSADASGLLVGIGPAAGDFPGRIATRSYTIRVFDQDLPPAEVRVDGSPTASWTHDMGTRTLTITLPATSTDVSTAVAIDPPTP